MRPVGLESSGIAQDAGYRAGSPPNGPPTPPHIGRLGYRVNWLRTRPSVSDGQELPRAWHSLEFMLASVDEPEA